MLPFSQKELASLNILEISCHQLIFVFNFLIYMIIFKGVVSGGAVLDGIIFKCV